jgi:hypothetical protein
MASLEEMDGKLDRIITSVAKIEQRCIDRGVTIDGHRKTLYGNDGTGGVVAKVNTLNGINTTKEKWAMRIIGPIISALVIAALFGLFAMWKFSEIKELTK